MPDFTLETPYGIISITDTGLKNNAPALLLLHGNSSSSKIFHHLLSSPTLTSHYRLITFDFPGHGASSNAPNPKHDYTQRGYAELATHILEHLAVEAVVIFGWSLGGHVALEMVDVLKSASGRGCRRVELRGIMLCGTPPANGREQCRKAFKIPLALDGEEGEENLMAALTWTPTQASLIAHTSAPGGHASLFEDWMLTDAVRTDGRARMLMFDAFLAGRGADQVRIVATEDVPVAVVNGAEEPYVDLDYIDGLEWRRLWRGQCVRLEGLKHAPFWEDWGGFEVLLGDFLDDCARVEESGGVVDGEGVGGGTGRVEGVGSARALMV